MPEMNPKMIYRLDRFGRGGHHRPFNDVGFAGVRIMEAHENYNQQHQDIRIEEGIAYGDVIEAVNFSYAKKLTAVNAINLASLAWAPPSIKELYIGGVVEPSVKFKSLSAIPQPGVDGVSRKELSQGVHMHNEEIDLNIHSLGTYPFDIEMFSN